MLASSGHECLKKVSDSSLYILYLCVVQQGEKIYGAEDRDMEEWEELLHGSLKQSVCS